MTGFGRSQVVVDASVVCKWLLPEPGSAAAMRLLERNLAGETRMLAPNLLTAEVGNVIWKRLRRGELTFGEADRAVDMLLMSLPKLVDSPLLAKSAYRLAAAHGCTVYDCYYLALAIQEKCDLVTADERLCNALSDTYPFLRLLEA